MGRCARTYLLGADQSYSTRQLNDPVGAFRRVVGGASATSSGAVLLLARERTITMAMLTALLAGSSAWMVGQGPLTRSATAATAGRARVAELQMDEGAMAASRPDAFVGSSFGSSAIPSRQGTLVLEDGTRLRGVSFGYEESIAGEHLPPIHTL